jgi:hypothetical protein
VANTTRVRREVADQTPMGDDDMGPVAGRNDSEWVLGDMLFYQKHNSK